MSLDRLPLFPYDHTFLDDPDARAVSAADKVAISENQAKELMKWLFQDGASDLNFTAQCNCGDLTGNFYMGWKCSKCGTVVRNNFADELKFRLWLEIPDLLPPMLHPRAYYVLEKWLGSVQGVPVLKSLLDVNTPLPPILQGVVGQGFRYFHDNFNDLMMYFLTKYPPLQTAAGKRRSRYIPDYLNEYRKILFIRHFPILNEALHLITRSGSMQYSDECCQHILKARIELSNMIYSYHNSPNNANYLEQRMYTMYSAILDYVDSIVRNKLVAKEGFIRKSILGSRCHCSCRAVIVPLNEDHESDELHVPWRIGVAGLKLEIINILTKRMGYSYRAALALQFKALSSYDPVIDKCMNILLQEVRDTWGFPGTPLLFGRNPDVIVQYAS